MAYKVLCQYHLEGLSKCEQFEGDGEKCRNYEKCEKWKETSKKILMVGKVKDGDRTAEIFMSFYMNSFLRDHKSFYDEILKEKRDVINNFNYLCFSWLIALSGMEYYDDRNEDSVRFAKKYKALFEGVKPEYIKINKKIGEYIVVCYRSDLSMAEYIIKYLSVTDNCDDFIKHAIYAHKSLQQNLTRFIYKWFCYYLESGKKIDKEMKAALKEICADKVTFRYI
ncbi:MAG: hypothetical protein IJ736_13195 [Firmicutes bacterium]|nr:hypothetical protein [Bacillota bacterium]